MLARVKAMIKHMNRSMSDELIYYKEECTCYHPDENEYWYSRTNLWIRGESSLNNLEEYEYFYKYTQ